MNAKIFGPCDSLRHCILRVLGVGSLWLNLHNYCMWKSKITVTAMTLAGMMPAQRPLALQAAAGRQVNESPYEQGQEETLDFKNA